MGGCDEAVGETGFTVSTVGYGRGQGTCEAGPVVEADVVPVGGPGAERFVVEERDDGVHCFLPWRMLAVFWKDEEEAYSCR